ncbi:alkaline phosphatase-like [Haematobia irritans]|uniref:alkaline phosphatase-like n=1 Tax=Haematobia irritans TaxID=7368 RepID=UPI003F4FD9C1
MGHYHTSLSEKDLKDTLALNNNSPIEERDPKFWQTLARQELLRNLGKQRLNKNRAKNIIFFLGDGMSLSTVTAARILKSQRNNGTGEEELLSFEKFPHVALSRTHCTNTHVADSACAATAFLCGVKANILTLGVSAKVNANNCSASMDPANHVQSIAVWAQNAGKSTGFVTTTSVLHASPAGTFAHVANRFWESDSDVLAWKEQHKTTTNCMDIAQQLILRKPGRNFNVIMGGGMGKFLPKSEIDDHGNRGVRSDGKNLLKTWKSMHPLGVLVSNRDQLLNVNVRTASHIMGLFESSGLKYHALANKTKQPSLSEMTKMALERLQRNKIGYFLFVEGGNIDTAHHESKAGLALDETLEFDKAVEVALEMTDTRDTLIVVTADHSHPLTIVGYPYRGTSILGLNHNDRAADGMKYSNINYPLGPNLYRDKSGRRINLDTINRNLGKSNEIHKNSGILSHGYFSSIDSQYPSGVRTQFGTHSGEDVGVYALGPYDHLFTGVLQQSSIPHIMAYAACIGKGLTKCNDLESWK